MPRLEIKEEHDSADGDEPGEPASSSNNPLAWKALENELLAADYEEMQEDEICQEDAGGDTEILVLQFIFQKAVSYRS